MVGCMVRAVLVKQRLQPPHHDQLSLTARTVVNLDFYCSRRSADRKWTICGSHEDFRTHLSTTIAVITELIHVDGEVIAYMRNRADSKLVQRDGNLTMAG